MHHFLISQAGTCHGITARANETVSGTEHVDQEWQSRWDWKTLEQAEAVATAASNRTGKTWIATDSGSGVSPRFDVVEAPNVGDQVSYAFNGDSYPDGKIVSISKSLKVVTTDTGNKYYRKRQSARWVLQGGTFSMIAGHVSKQNPEF